MSAKGYTGEKHPELFASLPDKSSGKLGQLSESQLKEFKENGYILVKNFFSKEKIDECRKAVEELVEDLAQKLYKDGKIKDLYQDKSFHDRLIYMENDFPGTNIILHKVGFLPKAFRSIASDEKLLNLLETFLGPNITFNPVWNLRTKTPKNLATEVPWHQDAGYFDTDAYNQVIMTAWIPLIHATSQNGTMEMVKKGHKEATVAMHECCAGPTWYIQLNEDEMKNKLGVDPTEDNEVMDVPMGSFILFTQFTPHRSLPNISNEVRWALDFRWNDTSKQASLFGLKDGCELRTSTDTDLQPDWEKFDAVDRNTAQHEDVGIKHDEYSRTIMGPWMGQWPIVHHNQHTEAYIDDKTQWDVNMVHG